MRARWFSGRATCLHLAIVVWFPGCLVAGWWQVNRAFDGNGLSYLYSIEWPIFALVGVWAWWVLIHTDPETVGRRAQQRMEAARRTAGATGTEAGATGTEAGASATVPVRHRDEEDEELAAYNDRLAALAARGPRDLAGPVSGTEGALLRYRIMAFVVGTGLFVLVFVGVPLQYAAGEPAVDAVVGPIHGFLYIVYLVAAVDLARRARFTLLQMAAMIGAGFLPFLAFIIEHRVNLRIRGMLAGETAGTATGEEAEAAPPAA